MIVLTLTRPTAEAAHAAVYAVASFAATRGKVPGGFKFLLRALSFATDRQTIHLDTEAAECLRRMVKTCEANPAVRPLLRMLGEGIRTGGQS